MKDEGTAEKGKKPRGERKRLRELGVRIGRFKPGKYNAITDVKGVRVGHVTLIEGDGKRSAGKGPVRTGVTAIIPNDNIFHERLIGGTFVLNGAGEVAGITQLSEWSLLETPILLTHSLSVGLVADACAKWMIETYPGIGDFEDVVLPVVGECDDTFLNEAAGEHIRIEHVYQAIESARSGPVAEGSVGGGTGMVTCDFKAGIGTSSRRVPGEGEHYTLGVLVMTNWGGMDDLRIDGVPAGALLVPEFAEVRKRERHLGSIIVVVATDAPMLPNQMGRLCKRAALGIGRAGSIAAHASGEIIVGFSTANKVPRKTRKMTHRVLALLDDQMNNLYQAVVEATEEAILNALCMAEPMTGVDGNFAPALPLDRVEEIMLRYRPTLPGPPRGGIKPG